MDEVNGTLESCSDWACGHPVSTSFSTPLPPLPSAPEPCSTPIFRYCHNYAPQRLSPMVDSLLSVFFSGPETAERLEFDEKKEALRAQQQAERKALPSAHAPIS
jgi:hypothetical protein